MGEYKYVAYMVNMLYVLFFVPIFMKGDGIFGLRYTKQRLFVY